MIRLLKAEIDMGYEYSILNKRLTTVNSTGYRMADARCEFGRKEGKRFREEMDMTGRDTAGKSVE